MSQRNQSPSRRRSRPPSKRRRVILSDTDTDKQATINRLLNDNKRQVEYFQDSKKQFAKTLNDILSDRKLSEEETTNLSKIMKCSELEDKLKELEEEKTQNLQKIEELERKLQEKESITSGLEFDLEENKKLNGEIETKVIEFISKNSGLDSLIDELKESSEDQEEINGILKGRLYDYLIQSGVSQTQLNLADSKLDDLIDIYFSDDIEDKVGDQAKKLFFQKQLEVFLSEIGTLEIKNVENEKVRNFLFDKIIETHIKDKTIANVMKQDKEKYIHELLVTNETGEIKIEQVSYRVKLMETFIKQKLIESGTRDEMSEIETESSIRKIMVLDEFKQIISNFNNEELLEKELIKTGTGYNFMKMELERKLKACTVELKSIKLRANQDKSREQQRQGQQRQGQQRQGQQRQGQQRQGQQRQGLREQELREHKRGEGITSEEAAERIRNAYKGNEYNTYAREQEARKSRLRDWNSQSDPDQIELRRQQAKKQQARLMKMADKERREERLRKSIETHYDRMNRGRIKSKGNKEFRNPLSRGGGRRKKKRYYKKTKKMKKTRRNRLKTRRNRLKTRKYKLKTKRNKLKTKRNKLKTKRNK